MKHSPCKVIVVILLVALFPSVTMSLTTVDVPADWMTFESAEHELTFQYPSLFTIASQGDGWVQLTHSVPFVHQDPCNRSDEGVILDAVVDFDLKLMAYQGSLREAVLARETEYVSARLFDGNQLRTDPGFIDEVRVGSFEGYRVTSGTHGCGTRMYFLIVEKDRTLIVCRGMVGEFSKSYRLKEEVLKLPGIISSSEAEELFKGVIGSCR